MNILYSIHFNQLPPIAQNLIIILGVFAALAIIWSLIAIIAMRRAIHKRPDVPFEVLVEKPGTAWNNYKEPILKGVEWIRSMPFTEVSVTSHDSLRLCGKLIEQKEDAKATIIMFHGYRSGGTNDFSCATEFYYSLGFNLLIVDQRSHGKSEGKYIGFGALERFDCQKWAYFIEQRYGKELPIFLTGVSMGASTVLMASSLEMPENLLGIISDCPFNSPYEIISHVIKKDYHINPKIIMPSMDFWAKIFAKYSFKEISTVKALSEAKVPVLFIHGLADDFVPHYMTEESFEACASEKEVIYVENAGHGESYLVDGDRCREVLKRFVNKQFDKFHKKIQ